MKKLCSIILILSVAASALMFNVYADETVNDERYLQICDFLASVGIYDDDADYNADKILSRGEFIHYAYRLLNQPVYQGGDSPFWDLANDYEYYNSVVSAKNASIVNGHENGSIRVYDYITSQEAATIIVNALGYNNYILMSGNYQDGLNTIISNLDLFNGCDMAEKVTFRDMTILLYNALNAPLMKQVIYGDIVRFENIRNESVLTKNFNIYLVRGIVQADEISSISNHYNTTNNAICIDGKVIPCNELPERFLGYNAECYYYEKDDECRLIYIRDFRNEVIKITSDNGPELVNGKLAYNENGKTKYISFGTTTAFLYNGKLIDYATEYKKELFDVKEGEITCIDNNQDSVADVVFIDDYLNYVVQSYSANDEIMFFYNKPAIDFGKDNVIYDLTDKYGNKLLPSQLKANDVISVAISKDGEFIRGIVSYDVVTAKSSEYYKAGATENFVLNGTEYEVSPDIYAKNKVEFYNNVPSVYYLNIFGKIAYVRVSDSADGGKFALLTYASLNGGLSEEGSGIRILDSTDNEEKVLFFADKVKVDGVMLKIPQVVDKLWENAKSDGNLIAKFIQYTLNDDGKVVSIDTPVKNTNESDQSLIPVWEESDGTLQYKTGGYFVMNYYVDSDTRFYGIPTDADILNGDYECECYDSLTNDGKYTVSIYALGSETVYMKGALVNKDTSNSNKLVDEDNKLYVVQKVGDSINDKGEVGKQLSLVSSAGSTIINVTENEYHFINGIDKGDVIRFGISQNGKINALHWIYDYSKDEFVVNNDKNGNPANPYDYQYLSSANWVYSGTVYDTYDKFMKIALMSDADLAAATTIPKNKLVNIEVKNGYVAEVGRDGVTLTAVDMNSLKTYVNSGKDAYKVIDITKYRQYVDILFIK